MTKPKSCLLFRQVIEANGITSKQIQEALNVSPSTVTRWMNGDREPNACTVIKMCIELGLNPSDFLPSMPDKIEE